MKTKETLLHYLNSKKYLFLFRFMVLCGVCVRFLINLPTTTAIIRDWVLLLVIIALLVNFIISRLPTLNSHSVVQKVVVISDVFLVSSFYLLSSNPQSDFFLFYYLPILTAAEYFDDKALTLTFFGVVTSFGAVLITMGFLGLGNTQDLSVNRLLFQTFLPRTIFFISVVAFMVYLLRSERRQRENLASSENEKRKLLSFRAKVLARREREIDALRKVDEVIAKKTVRIESVLDTILEQALSIIEAKIGIVMWVDDTHQMLELKAQRGYLDESRIVKQSIHEGIIGLVARSGKAVLAENVESDNWRSIYKRAVAETRTELTVPLKTFTGQVLGVLDIQDGVIGSLTDDDKALLERFAIQGVIAFHSIDLYEKLDRQVKSLQALTRIASRLQTARVDLDIALRLLLTGVTANQGVGLSRAMLFLLNDTGDRLMGKLAVGAQNRKEAESTWLRLDNIKERNGYDDDEMLDYLLDDCEKLGVIVKSDKNTDCALSLATSKIEVPLGDHALWNCLKVRKPIIVGELEDDAFRDFIERVSSVGDRGSAFVCIPLNGRTSIVGVLVADSRFLRTEAVVDSAIVGNLDAFGNALALTIENYHLYEKLKLDNSRYFAATTAHVIGNSLNGIEFDVDRLNLELQRFESFDNNLMLLQGVDKLKDGIARTKRLLEEYQRFARPDSPRKQRLEMKGFLQAKLKDNKSKLHFRTEFISSDFDGRECLVDADPMLLGIAFDELIENACEATDRDIKSKFQFLPCLRVILSFDPELLYGQKCVRIEIINAGQGIPYENKDKIWAPMFTTKNSSGLGLPIVRDIILAHKGSISEEGAPNIETRMVLRLLKSSL